MARLVAIMWSLSALGCGAEPVETDDEPGACGAESEHEITVLVRVHQADGRPAQGATVLLEERATRPGVRGEATTDAQGDAELQDLSITSLEGCWGIALDYVVVASLGEQMAEVAVNPSLFSAISQGEDVVDRRERPLVLPAP